ncbi:MAG: DUF2071 domain-containing protein [Acidobacteria bacterium]|jgi:hypothetical protein|nr:DUF2071 domain-containing protein [Acidobacteriota bacterium]
MLHLLKRHPFPVRAFFRHCLVLTYAFPERVLVPLLAPGLTLDTYQGLGFLAIALVQTEGLRPVGVPAALGQDFFLTGYRIFSRFRTAAGRSLRGLRILRSDTDRELMVLAGNALTHYHYVKCDAQVREEDGSLEVRIQTGGEADLHVIADLAGKPAPLPAGSPFPNLHAARKFAGPLPFTFDYEAETHSIVRIQGVRRQWNPEPVAVEVRTCTFLAHPPFARERPVLANAFHLQDVPYRWERGICEPLPGGAET